jgi:hypothetical protein
MYATIQEVNSAIMFGDFTSEQLRSVVTALQFRRSQDGKETKRALRIGAQVKFTESRRGQQIIGEVQKINIKYIKVKSGALVWNVPAHMLEVV